MSTPDSDEPIIPQLSPSQGPPRRVRRFRGVRRLRVALAIGVVAIGGTTLIASPLGEAVRTQTQELLSTVVGDDAPDEGDEPDAEVAGEVESVVPQIVFDDSVFVDPQMVGLQPPWAFDGLLTFRGSPTRSFYGRGPVPDDPAVQWRFPEEGEGGLCRQSTVGTETRTWCGLGWTGQSALFRLDGRLWSVFGALDGAVHFLDAETGEALLPRFLSLIHI